MATCFQVQYFWDEISIAESRYAGKWDIGLKLDVRGLDGEPLLNLSWTRYAVSATVAQAARRTVNRILGQDLQQESEGFLELDYPHLAHIETRLLRMLAALLHVSYLELHVQGEQEEELVHGLDELG